MKQNKKNSGLATRLIAFVLLGAMVLGAVIATVMYFMQSFE